MNINVVQNTCSNIKLRFHIAAKPKKVSVLGINLEFRMVIFRLSLLKMFSFFSKMQLGYGRREAVEHLLAMGANVLARDDGGLIPLHNACSFGHAEVSLFYFFKKTFLLFES